MRLLETPTPWLHNQQTRPAACYRSPTIAAAYRSVGEDTPPEAMILMQCAPLRSSSLAALLTSASPSHTRPMPLSAAPHAHASSPLPLRACPAQVAEPKFPFCTHLLAPALYFPVHWLQAFRKQKHTDAHVYIPMHQDAIMRKAWL